LPEERKEGIKDMQCTRSNIRKLHGRGTTCMEYQDGANEKKACGTKARQGRFLSTIDGDLAIGFVFRILSFKLFVHTLFFIKVDDQSGSVIMWL
jgi:hypothetical protein